MAVLRGDLQLASAHARAASAGGAADDVELAATCAGNAALATSGRTALCFAPWVDDVERCLGDAQLSLWIELSSCQARNDPSTAVAVVPTQAVERLRPIDPEKLLEDSIEKPAAPKPPPPPQVAQAAPPPPPPPPPPQQLSQQVVETVKPSEDKAPDNARFLSEFNTRVDKQTVSRGARNEPMVAKAKPEELTAKTAPRDPSTAAASEDRVPGRSERAPDVPGKLSMRAPGAVATGQSEQDARQRGSIAGAEGVASSDGYVAKRGDGAFEQQRRERIEVPRGEDGAGGGAPRAPNLKASNEVLERALGGGSVDHLEDVESGDETALNSKQWLHASFFNRIKRQVAQNWDPETVWRRSDPRGAVYGFKTRITEVRVSLSRRGDVAKVVVTGPSGVLELDEEAVRAFRAAGPFPNPPDVLVERDNLITFAFSFVFEIGSSRITWRVPTAM